MTKFKCNQQKEKLTYKPKEERNFRVVPKNMHPITDINEIKKGL